MMFNSVVFHVAGEFVAVERWTVVSFQNVGIPNLLKIVSISCFTFVAVRVFRALDNERSHR